MTTNFPLPFALLLVLAVSSAFSFASDPPPTPKPSLVDLQQFSKITVEATQARMKQMVTLEKFQEMAKDENTILLDTRSKKAFDEVHLKGSVHLNFSDFTKEKLAKVIPNKDTRILIYCNNNFSSPESLKARFAALADKSPGLALNIPTFINLYGYGYKNVYELSELLDVTDPRITLEGTAVEKEL